MTRNAWIYLGVFVVVALGAAFYLKSKNAGGSTDQSQLPAEEAEANYTVPPDIGSSGGSNAGGLHLAGDSSVDYTVSQANSLPVTPTSTSI